MSTLYDIASWAAVTRLKREDILPEAIDAAKNVYLRYCGRIPFEELKVLAAERTITSGSASHSFSDLEPRVAGILSLRLRDSSNRITRMRRSHTRLFDAMSTSSSGRPFLYARFGDSLEFDKTTDQAYYIRMRYWRRPTLDADVGETEILTPPEWDELYQWETLHSLYTMLEEHEKAMMLMQPAMMPRGYSTRKIINSEIGIIPRLLNDLLRSQQDREGQDEDFSVNPIVRRYC